MNRIRYFDIAKGIAILAVMLGHSILISKAFFRNPLQEFFCIMSALPSICHYFLYYPVISCTQSAIFAGAKKAVNLLPHMRLLHVLSC